MTTTPDSILGRVPPALFAAAAIWAGPLSIIGCSSDPAAPVVAPDPYAGPAVSLDSSGEFHVVIVESPSPGYSVLVERIDERRGYDEAFVTIRTPNPRFAFPQVVVQQRALTSVRNDRPLRVNARVIAFDGTDGAYRAAVAAGGPR
ncbi:MAG: hypothetical protein ACOYN0_08970 [Phycisphaerales bacterium]